MADAKPPRPHLVSVGDAADETSAAAGGDRSQASDPAGRGWQLWLLVALLLAACVALVVQTQHAGELRQTVSALEGELFTTRTALDAYELRFSEVRDSVGSLKAQLEQLNALVNADPLAEPAAPGSPARADDSSESGFAAEAAD